MTTTTSSDETSRRRAAYRESLRHSPMFRGLSDELLVPVLDICEVQQWPRGSYLFRQGDPVVGFFLLRRGAVSIQRLAPDGSEKVIHVFRTNETFAEGALASPGYPADALAVEDCETIRIARAGFLKLLQSKNEFALRTILSLSKHLRLLVDDIEGQQGRDSVERVGEWLLQRCGDQGSSGDNGNPSGSVEIQLGGSKQVLAAELRMRSETLSRVLAKLREQGVITVDGRTVVVRDVAELRRRVGGV